MAVVAALWFCCVAIQCGGINPSVFGNDENSRWAALLRRCTFSSLCLKLIFFSPWFPSWTLLSLVHHCCLLLTKASRQKQPRKHRTVYLFIEKMKAASNEESSWWYELFLSSGYRSMRWSQTDLRERHTLMKMCQHVQQLKEENWGTSVETDADEKYLI